MPDQKPKPPQPRRGLMPKTKEFLDLVVTDRKISRTQAYLDTHETNNRATAKNAASKLINRPASQIYLKKHLELAKSNKIQIMNDAMKSEKTADRELANKVAEQIMDRELGKAVQRQISENKNLNINVEASQELSDKFTEFLLKSTMQ